MDINIRPLEKMEQTIEAIREKGVLLDDEDLIKSAKELTQSKKEIEEFIKACLQKVEEVRNSIITAKEDPTHLR